MPSNFAALSLGCRHGGRMDVISNSAARYVRFREEEMSIDEYLALCQRDPMVYEGLPSACWRP